MSASTGQAFLGQAALKHERIPAFPAVPEPETPSWSFSTEWNLKPKVLAIVNDNATAIDARLPEGPITLSKLHPKLDVMSVAEGGLESYAQYPDCRNGAVIRVKNGPALEWSLASHHYLLTTGHNQSDIQLVGNILDFSVEAF